MIDENSGYYIVPQLPACGFPCEDNRHGTCGQHALKTIIEGIKGGPARTWQEYSTGPISRMTGNMLPRNLVSVLQKHGLKAEYFHGSRRGKQGKIELLKEKLKSGPVILLISHAYSSKRHFSFRRIFTKQHYISLRGYDDEKKIFFAYDSNTKRNHEAGKLPAGNLTLTYERLLRYRRLSCRGIHRNLGIAITING